MGNAFVFLINNRKRKTGMCTIEISPPEVVLTGSSQKKWRAASAVSIFFVKYLFVPRFFILKST